MNLGGIPFGNRTIGFTVVTARTLVVCVLLYKRFKRIDWR